MLRKSSKFTIWNEEKTTTTATSAATTSQRADFENGLRRINEHRSDKNSKQKIGDEAEGPKGMAKLLFSDCHPSTHTHTRPHGDIPRQSDIRKGKLLQYRFPFYSSRIAFPMRIFKTECQIFSLNL